MEITFSNEEKDGLLIKTAYFGKDPYYFKIPLQYKDEITDLADPFIILLIFKMMDHGGKIFIKGKVSKSLLDNLELFTSYWNALMPKYYKKIEIIADEEIQDDPKPLADKAIATFSGGMDASFMLYRHKKGLAGRNSRNIERAVILSGFDTPVDQKERFKREFNACKTMCDDLGVELIQIEMNYRYYPTRWYMEFLACGAAALRLWKNYPYQVMASSSSLDDPALTCGSNPITDRFLSSNWHQVIVDDIDFKRMDKAALLKDWKACTDNLIICWFGGGNKALNCGICEKCMRTHLNFRAAGIKNLSSMALPLTIENIKEIKFNKANIRYYHEILDYTKKNNVNDDVFIELERAMKKYYRKEKWKWLTAIRAKLMSKITFGKKKEHYIQKAKKLTTKEDSADIYLFK